jgi:mRNA-degrading endonuclease YafQ of YafQ-DinJ toxin-antitoxin module
MHVYVTCNTTKVTKRILKMTRRLRHIKQVEVGTMLSDWQTQDMHRHRPGTKRYRGLGKALTLVRPHSLYEMEHSKAYGRKLTRIAKRSSRSKRKRDYVLPTSYLLASQRPILREVLQDKLIGRFQTLRDSIRW